METRLQQEEIELKYQFEERAGIYEYDAGLERSDAESRARVDIRERQKRKKTAG